MSNMQRGNQEERQRREIRWTAEGFPMSIGTWRSSTTTTLVSSSVGPEYCINIMSFVDKTSRPDALS